MRAALVFVYGALIEGHDPDTRDDIDAIIDGRPLPSAIRAEAERIEAWREFARQGGK